MSAMYEQPGADPHLGELAELYALGALEPHERAHVESHIAGCAACTRELAAAESTVAALDEAFVPHVAPPERLGARIAASAAPAAAIVPLAAYRQSRRPAWSALGSYATAAALLLAAGIGGAAVAEHAADVRQAAHDSAILSTIATSHFNHVTFSARAAGVPVSKVLYAHDGAWFYVVIDGSQCDCRIVAHSAAGERDLGKPEVRGSTATLFVREVPRPSALELVDASGRTISDARLAYPFR